MLELGELPKCDSWLYALICRFPPNCAFDLNMVFFAFGISISLKATHFD
jgi:hypothetical protein